MQVKAYRAFNIGRFILIIWSVEGFVLSEVRRVMRTKATIHPEISDSNYNDNDEAWLPDRERLKGSPDNGSADFSTHGEHPQPKSRQIYTQDEEDMINALGGRSMTRNASKREPGFLGDCTIKEIARDFQVPIPYLADVLCTWGVSPPINCEIPVGDMVTGEHCFAILEAIHTLDVGVLYDKYSNYDIVSLCDEHGIDLKDAFQLAIKENWNLPFGVQTHLRVEQEAQMLQQLIGDDFTQ